MKFLTSFPTRNASLLVALSISTNAFAASCCGGGDSNSIVLAKFGHKMLAASVDIENYKGFWNQNGDYLKDPKGAELNQYRLNLGYAQRLGDNWQGSILLPYVWNDNQYSGVESQEHSFGDTSLNVWYETFDRVTCIYKVNTLSDLKPSIYLGGSLTLPTGSSAYGGSATNSFEITGRGMYRFDANMIIEKTVYPYTLKLQGSYGKYLTRSVNREYNEPVKPYTKRLGDRKYLSISGGYTFFLAGLDTLTFITALSDVRENAGSIDQHKDPQTEMKKQSIVITSSYTSADLRYIFKTTWSHAFQQDDRGKNFSVTDILTLGLSYAFN